MNLCGSFQYRATEVYPKMSPIKQSHQRTIVMQAGDMKFDLRPRRDRECCFSAINITHCYGGILFGELGDPSYLIVIVHRWHLPVVRTHSIKRTGGL